MTAPDTTALVDGADSASPGRPLPAGTKILCIYIGERTGPLSSGAPDAMHVWTIEEANWYLDPHGGRPELYGGPDLRVLPVYVHDYPGDPAADAQNAADAMADMGWAPNLGRLVFWDAEMLVDAHYCAALNLEVRKRGCLLGKYGSQGFINRNPPVDGGTWMATDSKVKPVTLSPDRVGDQWLFSAPWDRSVFSAFVYDNCGRGPRRSRP